VGEEPNHTTMRKPGPLLVVQYSLEQSNFNPAYIWEYRKQNIEYFAYKLYQICVYKRSKRSSLKTTNFGRVLTMELLLKDIYGEEGARLYIAK
jgi:hypothetical protein